MTELAVVGLGSAGAVIVVTVLMFLMGKRAADAERAAGDARVDAATKSGLVTSQQGQIATLTEKNTKLEQKTNALSAACDRIASLVPPELARELVLARSDADQADTPSGDRTGSTVPLERPTEGPKPGDTDLLRPGE